VAEYGGYAGIDQTLSSTLAFFRIGFVILDDELEIGALAVDGEMFMVEFLDSDLRALRDILADLRHRARHGRYHADLDVCLAAAGA
jgi:hypothetical protein